MFPNYLPGPFYHSQARVLGHAKASDIQEATFKSNPCFQQQAHPLHLHPSPQFQQHAYDLIFPSSLLLCTAQLTGYICVYCAISAEYSEQGNDRQQRPGANAPALCITSYLRRTRPSSSLKSGCITDSSFQAGNTRLSGRLAECSLAIPAGDHTSGKPCSEQQS